MLLSIVWFLGWVVLVKAIYHLVKYLYCVFANKGKDLRAEYTGKEGFALVTGSTDGIGFAFAKELAKRGVNVIITGRSSDKLKNKMEELRNSYPKVDVQGIFVDFSTKDFMATIEKETRGRDIGILVNNVATILDKGIGELTQSEIENTIHLNSLVHSLMLNYFLPLINRRTKRSGLIDVASTLSLGPAGGYHFQAAAKAFTRSLTLSTYCSQLYKNIDFQCLMPGWTKTNMLPNHFLSPILATPESVAEGSLRDLGVVLESFGSGKHYLNAAIRQSLSFVLPVQFRDMIIGGLEALIRKVKMST